MAKKRSAQMQAAADYWIHQEIPPKFGALADKFGLTVAGISIAAREDKWAAKRELIQKKRNDLAVSISWTREALQTIEAERKRLADEVPILQGEAKRILAALQIAEPNSAEYKRLTAVHKDIRDAIAHASGKDLYDATLRKKLTESPKGLTDGAGQSPADFDIAGAIDLETGQETDLDGEPLPNPTQSPPATAGDDTEPPPIAIP